MQSLLGSKPPGFLSLCFHRLSCEAFLPASQAFSGDRIMAFHRAFATQAEHDAHTMHDHYCASRVRGKGFVHLYKDPANEGCEQRTKSADDTFGENSALADGVVQP